MLLADPPIPLGYVSACVRRQFEVLPKCGTVIVIALFPDPAQISQIIVSNDTQTYEFGRQEDEVFRASSTLSTLRKMSECAAEDSTRASRMRCKERKLPERMTHYRRTLVPAIDTGEGSSVAGSSVNLTYGLTWSSSRQNQDAQRRNAFVHEEYDEKPDIQSVATSKQEPYITPAPRATFAQVCMLKTRKFSCRTQS